MRESSILNLALIVGSTRPGRFADVPAQWIVQGAAERSDFELEVLDLRDWPLPMYEEEVSPLMNGGAYSNPLADRWRKKIGEFDGFIVTAAEYNHGPTAVLKNALDSALIEWNDKPIGFVGYGFMAGARAIEHLRAIAIELQMAPIKEAVHIGPEPFLGVQFDGKTLGDYPFLTESRTATLDQLVWWAHALKTARDASGRAMSAA